MRTQNKMFLMKVMMVSILLALIQSGMSRPSPANRRNHIMKKTDEMEVEIVGNETRMKMRKEYANKPKNSDLIKALAQVDYEYEEYDDYDVPIIEIRFRREAATEEEVRTAFKKMKKEVLKNSGLMKAYLQWTKHKN